MKKRKLLVSTIALIVCLAVFSTNSIFAGAENFKTTIDYMGNTYEIQKTDGFFSDTVEVKCKETGEKAIASEKIFSDKIEVKQNGKKELVINRNAPTTQEYKNELREAKKGKYRYIVGEHVNIDSKTIGYKEYKHTKKKNGKKWKCKAIYNNNRSKYRTFYYKKKNADWNRFSDAVDELDYTNKALAASTTGATASAGVALATSPTLIPAIISGLVALGFSGGSVALFLKLRSNVKKCKKNYYNLF